MPPSAKPDHPLPPVVIGHVAPAFELNYKINVESDEELFARRIGQVVGGRWTLERLLGVGGMAAVYAARSHDGRVAAVKLLHPEMSVRRDVRERFVREGYVPNKIAHPGAVQILEHGSTENESYLAMELLVGESLGERVRRHGTPPLPELLAYVDHILDVLIAAHDQNIIHRDLKPENLFITSDGRLKVLDFGLARLVDDVPGSFKTRTGLALGTLPYMAPEQALGRRSEIDGRVDLFALGATLFRILSGRRVHEANSEAELLMAMASKPAPPLRSVAPQVPPGVAAIIDLSLAFAREARYPDARTMQLDVRAVRAGSEPTFALSRLGVRDEATRVDRAAPLIAGAGSGAAFAAPPGSVPGSAAPGFGAPPGSVPSSGAGFAAPPGSVPGSGAAAFGAPPGSISGSQMGAVTPPSSSRGNAVMPPPSSRGGTAPLPAVSAPAYNAPPTGSYAGVAPGPQPPASPAGFGLTGTGGAGAGSAAPSASQAQVNPYAPTLAANAVPAPEAAPVQTSSKPKRGRPALLLVPIVGLATIAGLWLARRGADADATPAASSAPEGRVTVSPSAAAPERAVVANDAPVGAAPSAGRAVATSGARGQTSNVAERPPAANASATARLANKPTASSKPTADATASARSAGTSSGQTSASPKSSGTVISGPGFEISTSFSLPGSEQPKKKKGKGNKGD